MLLGLVFASGPRGVSQHEIVGFIGVFCCSAGETKSGAGWNATVSSSCLMLRWAEPADRFGRRPFAIVLYRSRIRWKGGADIVLNSYQTDWADGSAGLEGHGIVLNFGKTDRGCWGSHGSALTSSEPAGWCELAAVMASVCSLACLLAHLLMKLVFENSETDNRLTVGLEERWEKNDGVSKKVAAVGGNGVSKKVVVFGMVEQGGAHTEGGGLAVGEC